MIYRIRKILSLVFVFIFLLSCQNGNNQDIIIDKTKIAGISAMLAVISKGPNNTAKVLHNTPFAPTDEISLSLDVSTKQADFIVLLTYDENLNGKTPVIISSGESTSGLRPVQPVGIYYARVGKGGNLFALSSSDPNLELIQNFSRMVYVTGTSITPPTRQVPDEDQSDIAPSIVVTGGNNGAMGFVLDPFGSFSMTVRDSEGLPIEKVKVVLDFGACTYVRICSKTPNLQCHPNGFSSRSVSGVTDSNGSVLLTVVGTLTGPNAGLTGGACANLTANGILFSNHHPITSVTDLDASGTVGANDQGIVLFGDKALSTPPPRSDFDGSGTIDNADYSIWNDHFASGSVTTCPTTGTYCEP